MPPALENRFYQHTKGSIYVPPASQRWAAETLPFKPNAFPFLQRLYQSLFPEWHCQQVTWARGCLCQTLGHLASKKEPVLVVFVTPLPSNDIYQPPTPAPRCMRQSARQISSQALTPQEFGAWLRLLG